MTAPTIARESDLFRAEWNHVRGKTRPPGLMHIDGEVARGGRFERFGRVHPPRAMAHFLGGLFPRPSPDLLPVVLGPLPDLTPPPELPLPPPLPLPITFLLASIHCDEVWKICTTTLKAPFVPTLNLSSSRRISMG